MDTIRIRGARTHNLRNIDVDLPRGGTETIAFGLPAAGPADYLQMNVWALARVAP